MPSLYILAQPENCESQVSPTLHRMLPRIRASCSVTVWTPEPLPSCTAWPESFPSAGGLRPKAVFFLQRFGLREWSCCYLGTGKQGAHLSPLGLIKKQLPDLSLEFTPQMPKKGEDFTDRLLEETVMPNSPWSQTEEPQPVNTARK